MNAKRLLKLADFLTALPKQKFDFSVIAHEGEKPLLKALKARTEHCGTVACAIGWMPAVFPRLVRWILNRGWLLAVELKKGPAPAFMNFRAASEVFGISDDDAEYLFLPDRSGLGDQASAKRVAQHIRRFVKRGGKPS
jgi:hypothetical protein